MRKSAKILAVVLTLVLLVGALATAIFAAQPDLTAPTGAMKSTSNNFQSEDDGDCYSVSNDKGGLTSGTGGVSFIYSGRPNGKATVYSNGDNKYIRLETDVAESSTSNAAAYVAVSTHAGAYVGSYNTDYAVLEFDFCADQYIALADNGITGVDGTKYAKGELIPPENLPADADPMDYTLSYNPNALELQLNYNYASLSMKLTMNTADNSWQLAFGTGNKFDISNVVGEWNHITIIVDESDIGEDRSKAESLKAGVYFYLNGEFVHGGAMDSIKTGLSASAFANDSNFSEIRINNYQTSTKVTAEDGTVTYTNTSKGNVSMGFDNFASVAYEKGYTGTLATAFAGASYPETISYLKDTYFGNNYAYPAPNTPVADINGVDYYIIGAALQALAPDDVLTLYGDTKVENYVPDFGFEVICDEGAFTIVAGEYAINRNENGDGYIIALPDESSMVDVNVYGLAYPSGGPVISNGLQVGIGQAIDLSGITIEPKADLVNNTVDIRSGWEIYDDSNNTYLIDHVFTAEEIDAIGEIYVYPIFETINMVYVAKDASGNVLTDCAGYFCDITGLNDILAAKAGTEITVELLTDIEHNYSSTEDMFVINGDTILNINLNGHKWKGVNSSKANYFEVRSGAPTVNIYSTAENGGLYYVTNFDKGNVGLSLINVNTTTDGTTVNFGTIAGIEGADGANLEIMTGVLYTVEAESKNAININGGEYFSTFEVAAYTNVGFVAAANGETTVSINNAFVKADPLLSTASSSASKIVAVVDNSTIIAGTICESSWGAVGTLIDYFNTNSSVIFKNSYVIGDFDASQSDHVGGKITMDSGTYWNGGGLSHGGYTYTYEVNIADGVVAVASGKTFDFTDVRMPLDVAYRYTHAYNIGSDGTFPYAETAFTKYNATGSYITFYTKPTVVDITYKISETEIITGQIIGGVPTNEPTIAAKSTPFFTFNFKGWAVEGTTDVIDIARLETATTVVPVYGELEVKIQAYASIKLVSRLEQYIYLPYVDKAVYIIDGVEYTVSNVKFAGPYGATKGSSVVNYNGVDYHGFIASFGSMGANTLTGANNMGTTITFDLSYNGNDYTFDPVVNSSLSQIDYFTKALEASTDTVEKNMLATAARYAIDTARYWSKNTGNVYSDTNEKKISAFETLLTTTYAENIKTKVDAAVVENFALSGDALNIFSDIKFFLAESADGKSMVCAVYPAIKLNADYTGTVTSVIYTLPVFAKDNGDGTITTGQKWSSSNMISEDGTYGINKDGYRVYANEFIPIYSIGQIITITATYTPEGSETSETVSFEYSLATYAAALEAEAEKALAENPEADVTAMTDAIDYINSLLAFSDAALAYIAPEAYNEYNSAK